MIILPLFIYVAVAILFAVFYLNKRTLTTGFEISTKEKRYLVIYLFSAIFLFTYLCLPENSGIGITIFVLVQFIFMAIHLKNLKSTFLLGMSFLISLNYLIIGSDIFKVFNAPVILLLIIVSYSDCTNSVSELFRKILTGFVSPIGYFILPFKWFQEANVKGTGILKRILLGLALTVPSSIILILLLSGADMIFGSAAHNFIKRLSDLINVNFAMKLFIGIITGFYLFGIICGKYNKTPLITKEAKIHNGDLLIINIFLIPLLFIYSIFIFIQFRYLFASAALPYNLTYTEYARKGFFELIFLSGINIAVILGVMHFINSKKRKRITEFLLIYLCSVTFILLASSFYRMYLYCDYDGLTRLRFAVFIFLFFETTGLIFTLYYILRPSFNPIILYLLLGIIYYTALNLIPMDYIISQTQVNRYLNGKREEIDYVFSLSCDAAPALERLYNSTSSEELKERISSRLKSFNDKNIPYRWQRFNISRHNAYKLMKNPGK